MSRFRIIFYVLLISLVPLVFLGLPDNFIKNIKSFFNQISMPVMGFAHRLFQNVDDFFGVVLDIREVLNENADLREEVGRLKLDLVRMVEVQSENERLNKILKFTKRPSPSLASCRVIGRSPSQWNESFWIDRGAADGFREGMAVVTEQGVVGKIAEIRSRWSRVLLVVSETCRIGAMNQRTGEVGVIQGSWRGRDCILKYLPLGSQTKPGDLIVSSGLSSFFPAGLHIGLVQKIQDDDLGLFQFAEVLPSVNFSKVRDVFVIASATKDAGGDMHPPSSRDGELPDDGLDEARQEEVL